MKREDIEKAAKEYAERITDSCKGDRESGIPLLIELTFAKGAEWRLNSIWHTNSEKPRIGRTALVIYKGAGSDVCSNILSFEHWDSVDKWAYIEDLLPTK